MADRYWISNANSNANVSTNWADNPDGTGANTVPVATDIVHFGHATTIANDLGAGICTWDLNIALDEMYVYEGYNDIQFISEEISFSGSVITLPQDADTLAIRQGMRITITNSTSNDGTYTITSVSNADLTVSSSLTTEAAGATITLEYFASIDISSDFETNLLSLDGVLENTGGVLKTITLRGTPKVSSGSRYVLNGNNQGVRNRDKIAYDYRAKDSTPAYNDKILFDNGVYPIVKSTNGGTNFSSEYSIPTGDIFLYTDIYSLELTSSGCEFSKPASSSFTSQKNTEKQFYLQTTSNFAMDFTPFDAGFSTWTFKLDATNFNFPVTADTTNYGDSGIFTANWYNVVLDTSTAGYKATIPENRTLNLNSITIQPNTVLQGYFTINENKTSTVVCVARPKILGSWNFSQLADGVYVSLIGDALPITPAHSVAGRVQLSDGHGTFTSDSKLTWASATSELTVNGKLTVTGLIDPTGIVFSPQASNPELTNPLDTIWIDSETNHLFRGDRNVESTVHFNVRNDEGATIPVGSPLYSKGEIGGSSRIKVGIADASDPNKMPAIGLAMQEMNTTSTKDGNMILTGILNENITITGVAEQDIIYVAAHGGTAPYLTITRPTSPSHLVQNVGVCVRQAAANVSQGMKVAAIGRTNDSPNCSFLMVNTESTHPQARRLVAGTNITLTDGGAGGDLTIAASGGGGGSGTVTSVAATVPTGFTITGSPITTSGTLAFAFDTGYSLPTTTKQGQWDTAYGWGDHAGAGYLTSFTESDPIFTASAASGILAGDITNWNTAYGWGDHSTQGYLTSAPPETDPIFTASQAALITNAGSGDVSQGDTAFSWGDHSVAGYAPATPEVCVVNLANNVANFTPTGAYVLLQQTGNWASTNPNFNTATGLYTVATDGVYRISWQVSFRFTPVGQLQASRIFVNGSTAAQGPTSSSGAWPIGSASVLLTLSAGDTVGLYVYISTTGTTLVGDSLVPFSNHMSINKVSD